MGVGTDLEHVRGGLPGWVGLGRGAPWTWSKMRVNVLLKITPKPGASPQHQTPTATHANPKWVQRSHGHSYSHVWVGLAWHTYISVRKGLLHIYGMKYQQRLLPMFYVNMFVFDMTTS